MATEPRRILEAMTKRETRPFLPGTPAGYGNLRRLWVAMTTLLEYLDQQAVETVVFRRVASDAVCGGCGAEYRTHPDDEEFPFLTRACLGQLVKL